MRFAVALVFAAALGAQRGDQKGETQPSLPEALRQPPPPALSPAESLAKLKVADGYRVELAAAEPLVQAPVAAAFDADARLWVVEMRGFMPDVDGKGEREPSGRVVVLTDDDRDGRFDRSHTFVDGLVLPRAIAIVRDGALVLAPPKLIWFRDRDGDGKADAQEVVDEGFTAGLDNPEHCANGLTHGIDNWIELANWGWRYRHDGAKWRREPTFLAGQWGLSRDERGRRFYNYNSDALRADLAPAHYAVRNPNLTAPAFVNVNLLADQKVWPSHPTPGVNRGYRDQFLIEGKLAEFTAACGPAVGRGVSWFDRDVFVCEPAANLVRRCLLEEQDGRLRARNAHERREFLESSDERFRPVNLVVGPDRALYVLDMSRGVLQHRNFVTTFLRQQIVDRKLELPIDRGRIFRVVQESFALPGTPRVKMSVEASVPLLSKQRSENLAAIMLGANPIARDLAQQLLVERGSRDTATVLRSVMAHARSQQDGEYDEARLHLLWTLEGIGALDADDVDKALRDEDPGVRASAVRLAERFDGALARIVRRAGDRDFGVRLQVLLSLGELRGEAAEEALAAALHRDRAHASARSAAASGLHGREATFAARLIEDRRWRDEDQGPAAHGAGATLKLLAACVRRSRDAKALATLEAALAKAAPWQQSAVRDGLASAQRAASGPPRTLTVGEQAQVERGRTLYASTCVACHQASGNGLAGLAPPLLDSPLAVGVKGRAIRVVLHGLTGPVRFGEETLQMHMAPLATLDDGQVADVLSFVRNAFGHSESCVTAAEVADVRARERDRKEPWTTAELESIR